ncbi:protease [Lithospermum erythrorhizon]|uniref:Protease n=1 Tax=Lithospermum erythrorhizon TaxID=34254 RepID=A0AAV3Q6V7_LITER
MGVLISNRNRYEAHFRGSLCLDLSNFDHISKKRRVSVSSDNTSTRSRCSVYRFNLYPEAKGELPRAVHAPVKNNRFSFSKRGLFGSGKVSSADKMLNSLSNTFDILKSKYAKISREALGVIRHGVFRDVEDEVRVGVPNWRDKEKGKEVIVLDDEATEEDVTGGSSIEEVDMRIEKERPVFYGHQWNTSTGIVENAVDGKRGVGNCKASMSSPVINMEDLSLKGLPLRLEPNKWCKPPHGDLLDSARKRDPILQELAFQIQLHEKRLEMSWSRKKVVDVKQDVVREAFIPLSAEDRSELARAFAKANSRRKILVSHEKSNIDITGEILQCLRPGAWLNNEVINVYLELLKERENREPHKFLKCHFLNTFFYKKLIGGNGGYNFQAVRRWTTQRKLGYCLFDCDKIFVPIHKEVHWCLAVINKKDQKFQYLDSLGGRDDKVMKVLAMYYVDEVNEKTGNAIDVSSWQHEFVEDLPEQENGYDCGVFMIKYADFYSRGGGLHFKQEHMPYFRQRTAKEILRLKAD